MGNKDLLFMLENGEEFIKGIYKADEDKIYFLSVDENELLENVGLYTENLMHIYEENRIEVELLMQEISNDKNLLDKIKNNQSNKLLFRYNNLDFNKLLNLI